MSPIRWMTCAPAATSGALAELERVRGHSPAAFHRGLEGPRAVVMLCSGDHLGMDMRPVVMEATHAARDRAGAGSDGTRNIAGTFRAQSNIASSLSLGRLHLSAKTGT